MFYYLIFTPMRTRDGTRTQKYFSKTESGKEGGLKEGENRSKE
jgi:hypothetical protein